MKKLKKVLVYSSSSFLKKIDTKNILSYLSRECSLVDIFALEEKNNGLNTKKYDLVLSIGGDGIFLSASKFAYLKSIPILGLNFGRIGFLADLDKKDLRSKIKKVLEGNYIIDKRALLSGTVISTNETHRSISLNDIVINNRGVLKMIEMNIYVNENLITKQRSDGVIVATPTGSTAYAMSNGCPIVSPNSNVICIVPIAPHSYGQRSVIVNNTDKITIRLNNKSKNNSQVTFDGSNNLTIERPESIVIRKASKQLKIIHPNDYDYFDALSKKLKYEIKS
ncbi:MAG: NAD(+)/NADH kinase [Pseudomonadota bacterium]|nr:NAD(+)/NADH kinase [Pseudomonadota bacterium]